MINKSEQLAFFRLVNGRQIQKKRNETQTVKSGFREPDCKAVDFPRGSRLWEGTQGRDGDSLVPEDKGDVGGGREESSGLETALRLRGVRQPPFPAWKGHLVALWHEKRPGDLPQGVTCWRGKIPFRDGKCHLLPQPR